MATSDVTVGIGERVDLCRFVTCGSVDDGKSTLIGRLLYDSKQVMADQLEHVESASARRGDGYVNLALLTDGLRAEREQGITIDVAYRPFATPERRFIIADCPGHVQYTRNMVTGASTADLAVILIDARNGVVEQTRRHSFICSLLRIPRLLVAVNKMDLVDYSQDRFEEIARDFLEFTAGFGVEVDIVPISALAGDNVVDVSTEMGWYSGPTLLGRLETTPLESAEQRDEPFRFPVQWVVRPQSDEYHDYRGYAGQIASGSVRPGDEVVVLPAGHRTTVAAVESLDGELDGAEAPLSVVVRLSDDIDVSRGDMLVAADRPAEVTREIVADVCWMNDRPLVGRGRYLLRHTTREVTALVDQIVHRVDIHTLHTESAAQLELNDIGRIVLRTSAPLAVDTYAADRATGSFIVIDESTNETLGAGMITEVRPAG